MRIKPAFFVLLFSAASLAATERLDLGGLVLYVSDSPTAQIFHIVDQLSQWDVFTHKQYVRWADKNQLFDQKDRELLKQHAEMRKKRGWGNGFESVFLVEDSIENAAAKGIAAHLLSAAEANAERDILLHFAPKLQPLLDKRKRDLADLMQQLQREQVRLTPMVVQLARFAEVKEPLNVTVFLVAAADENSSGGEANGERLVVEAPGPDAIGVLLHESLHHLLRPREDAIKLAAEEAGINFQVLKEGIAYALYPGIMADTENGDRLIERLVRSQLHGTPLSDPFLQFDQLAAVIRPLLRGALAHNETISTFLPKATAKWRSIAAR